ncbi:hypothetical protein Rhe02_77850 [Rhizocola hellebori]|uniref:Uncharacterized protein n=1 Tax=Rhizocola hellebori TaxID=1392758 RepID=A0A8J3VL42_9ACTN|nr:hypothetical protein [Rhizocola hellebori]GIH09718.1 hypothetical protein Rhe02_77850 [Rhizocola hellebori]
MSAELLQVATDALRADAAAWRRHASTMNTIVSELGQLHFGAFERTTLTPMKTAYTEIWNFFHDRCAEGGPQFEVVAATLESIARKYERDEAARARQLEILKPR